MPVYILKRYRKVIPADDSVWHLGREIAFHATSDQKAIARAQKQDGGDLAPHGGLAILFDPRGRRLWESIFEPPAIGSNVRGLSSTTRGNTPLC
jgi:hypothetical protein